MQKKINNLNQEVFDFFQPINKWPETYSDNLSSVGGTLWHNIYGMDIETEGLNPYDNRFRIISVATSPKPYYSFGSYTLNGFTDDFEFNLFKGLVENPDNILVGHNIKYDINWIRIKFGIDVKCMLFDTMFAQYLIDENIESNSLAELTKMFPDLKGYKDDVNRDDLKRMAKDDVLIYNCKDADASRRLYDYFVPKLKTGGYSGLMTTASMVLPILSKMETRGVYLDKEYANKTQSKLFKEMVQLRYDMVEVAKVSFDPDSYKSLGNVLYNKMGFTATKFTPSGTASTDSEAIGYLVDQAISEQQSQFIDKILDYKKKLKLITTYYQPIERWTRYDGRVHTNYSLGKQRNEESSGGTVTGRLSSNNPNLQNIPRGKEHRGMFRASEGFILLDGDFSQLELRVAAYLSQEPVMMDAFNNGLDIHTAVMADLTKVPYDELVAKLKDDNHKDYETLKNDRVAIKRINFGILYGVQAKRLQRLLRIELGISYDLDYCKELINQWLNKYGKIREWINAQKIQAVANGYVAMPLGQRRRLPQASFDKTKEAAHALAQATNFPVQSLASWICLIGLIILDNYFEEHKDKIDGHIVMQVHDSVTSEIKLLNPNIFTDNSFIHISNQMQLEDIQEDVSKIMEQDTLQYIRDVFGVNINVPLVFETKISERWS